MFEKFIKSVLDSLILSAIKIKCIERKFLEVESFCHYQKTKRMKFSSYNYCTTVCRELHVDFTKLCHLEYTCDMSDSSKKTTM